MPPKPGPLTAGARVSWEDLPAPVRASIEQAWGAPVASARTSPADSAPAWPSGHCAPTGHGSSKAVSARAQDRPPNPLPNSDTLSRHAMQDSVPAHQSLRTHRAIQIAAGPASACPNDGPEWGGSIIWLSAATP